MLTTDYLDPLEDNFTVKPPDQDGARQRGGLKDYTEILRFLDDIPLTPKSKALLIHILRHASESNGAPYNESLRKVANHLRVSIGTVFRAKWELLEAGLIQVDKNHNAWSADKLDISF